MRWNARLTMSYAARSYLLIAFKQLFIKRERTKQKQKQRQWQKSESLFFYFGLSRLTSLQFIQYHVAGFCKLNIPQSPPSYLWDDSTFNNARLDFSTIFVLSFDPDEWCLKNGFHNGGLNSRPLGHKSSALTTRPRLLALKKWKSLIAIPKALRFTSESLKFQWVR